MADEAKTFIVEEARILFRNFSGEPDKFNAQGGKRTFAVVLDPKNAEEMARDGWNVKVLTARDEGDEDTPYISVAVNFKIRPPKVYLITSNGRTQLTEEMIGVLDWSNIETCDLIARAYEWEVGDKTGIKAYLQTMFVTVEEDELERKYANLEGV